MKTKVNQIKIKVRNKAITGIFLIACCIIPSAFCSAQSTLTNGLMAYWKLDGNSNDATGNGNNGIDHTVTYGLSYGIFGQGANYSGSASSYAQTSGNLPLTGDATFTISMWIKPTRVNSSDGIIEIGNDGEGNNLGFGILIGCNSSGDIAYPCFGVGNGSTAGGIVQVNQWQNIVLVKVPGNTPGSVSIYYNGALKTITNPLSCTINIQSKPVNIGSLYNYGVPRVDNPFSGSVDEVGLWSRALTAAEITSLYNSGKGLQYPFNKNNAIFLGTGF